MAQGTMHRIMKSCPIGIGWAAKLINVYLKTMVYVGRIGRPGLDQWIHSPIDNDLIKGIRTQYRNNSSILAKFESFSAIRGIEDYSQYRDLISGISEVCHINNWKLIEIEKLWLGTISKTNRK